MVKIPQVFEYEIYAFQPRMQAHQLDPVSVNVQIAK